MNEPVAVFEAMVAGWSRQQNSRQLGQATIRSREQLVRRFTEFAGTHPWEWTPGDVEDFAVSLTSGGDRLALSTIRGYHLTLRLFCDYLTDQRYEWAKQCRDRFDTVPSQVCNEWNTVAHLNDYEGKPQRRPLTYRELELLFEWVGQLTLLTASQPGFWESHGYHHKGDPWKEERYENGPRW